MLSLNKNSAKNGEKSGSAYYFTVNNTTETHFLKSPEYGDSGKSNGYLQDCAFCS